MIAEVLIALGALAFVGRRRVRAARARSMLGSLGEADRPIQSPPPSLDLLVDLADPSAKEPPP